MRRRHVRTVREEERPTLLLMAAGAVAGAAAGLYLGRRYRSMDAFLADVRGRFDDLKEIWYNEQLSSEDRVRLASDVADVDDLDVEDLEDDDEFDEYEDDELEDDGFVASDRDEDEDDDDDRDSFDDVEDDELEEDLAAVTRDNGVPETARRAEDDARRLEQRILRALRDEPVLGSRAIEIAVVGDGVVELTGAVHAIEEVARASALARNVAGVSMVLNRIVVRSGGNIDTASVARDPLDAPEA